MLYGEALDVALCWGWIDGQKGSLDEHYFYNGFSPRRSRSPWSQINREHVGRMRPPGQAEVDRAKGDGRWDAAYRQKDAETPADLQLALDASPHRPSDVRQAELAESLCDSLSHWHGHARRDPCEEDR